LLEEKKLSGRIDKVLFKYEGTEKVDVKEIMKLTEGHNLEISAEGQGIKINLILTPMREDFETTKTSVYIMGGYFTIIQQRTLTEE